MAKKAVTSIDTRCPLGFCLRLFLLITLLSVAHCVATSGMSARIGARIPFCHPGSFPDRNALPARTPNCVCTGCPVVKETSYFHLETTVQVRKACRSKGPTGRRRRLEAQGSAERLLRYSSRWFPGTRISLQQNNSGRWRREQLLRSTRGRRRFESCHEKQFSCG